ncbi:MAG: hypothetical protein GTO03_08145, partial [Planctomycetales bacterium]|nr:hypothetical protein [Planctomycetales bacterium]
EILGEKRVVSPDNGTAETWYKIAPPRGEFRWVFGRFVVPQGIAGTQAEHADPSELAGVRHRGPRAKDEADVAQAGGEKRADETRSIVRGVAAEQVAIPTAAYEGDRPGIALTSAQTSSSQADEGGLVYSTTRPRGRRMSAVEKLDGDLSLIVADPPAKWDFHTIRTRAQAALENSASALERGKAKELLSDIERYEQLQAGYAQIDAIRDETEQQNRLAGVAQAAAPGSATAKRPASAVPETVPATLASGATSDVDLAQFDGVGQLRPVVSRRAGAPRFALTGTAGEVLMFLTATPGVNLDQYVGQYVGLNGTRGYMPKLNQAHLTVARARPLASSILVARQP